MFTLVSYSSSDDCIRTLKIYGAANKRVELERKLIWATPGQRGFSARTGSGPAPVPGAPQRHQIPQPASYGSAYAGPSYGGAYGGSYGAGSSQRGVTVTKKLTPQQLAAQQAALKKQAEDMARAQELRQILNNLEKVDDQGRRSSLLDMLCPTDDLLALPEHPNPPGLAAGDLKVNLLKHQVRTIIVFTTDILLIRIQEPSLAVVRRARIPGTSQERGR